MAEFEKKPEAVVLKFFSRAAVNISPAKGQNHKRPGFQTFYELQHPGKEFAFSARQFQRKEMHVAVKEPAHVLVSCGNFIFAENAQDNSRVGHARDLDVLQIIIDSEPLFKCKYQCVDSRTARMDQRAV